MDRTPTTPFERQLDRAAGIIVGTCCHMWRPEWAHIQHPDRLANILTHIWTGYPTAIQFITNWWANPERPGWDTPWHHPTIISQHIGWDITETEGWHDPHLPWTLLRHETRTLHQRLTWWTRRHHATAILHQLQHGEPPNPDNLKALSV